MIKPWMIAPSAVMTEYPAIAMSNNTTPSPLVASASSEYNAARGAWAAFDKVCGSVDYGWSSVIGIGAEWLKLDLGAGNAISILKYKLIEGRSDFTAVYGPKDFTLQGSNDDAAWTTLDTRTGITWLDYPGSTQVKEFPLAARSAAWRYFLLNITANGGSPYTVVNEMILVG
jgi:hypothetical protein